MGNEIDNIVFPFLFGAKPIMAGKMIATSVIIGTGYPQTKATATGRVCKSESRLLKNKTNNNYRDDPQPVKKVAR